MQCLVEGCHWRGVVWNEGVAKHVHKVAAKFDNIAVVDKQLQGSLFPLCTRKELERGHSGDEAPSLCHHGAEGDSVRKEATLQEPVNVESACEVFVHNILDWSGHQTEAIYEVWVCEIEQLFHKVLLLEELCE